MGSHGFMWPFEHQRHVKQILQAKHGVQPLCTIGAMSLQPGMVVCCMIVCYTHKKLKQFKSCSAVTYEDALQPDLTV